MLARALEAVAKQDADHDSGRRQLLMNESRTLAVTRADRSLGDVTPQLGFLPPERMSAAEFAGSLAEETGSAGERTTGESRVHPRPDPRLGVAALAWERRSASIGEPIASLANPWTTAAHAGLLQGLQREERRLARDHDVPERDAGNNPFSQLLPPYAAPLRPQPLALSTNTRRRDENSTSQTHSRAT